MSFTIKSIDVWKSSMNTFGYLYKDESCVYISLYNTYTGTYMTHHSIFFICMQWISEINKVCTCEGWNVLHHEVYRCMEIFNEYMWISI
jgi:hypothetical protein